MGATGRMGGAVLRHADGPKRAGTRSGTTVADASETVRFDLDDPATFALALDGCDAMFVMRPPPSTTREPFDRLMLAAREEGIGFVVCASVFGADGSRVLPHRYMEASVKSSGIPHVFLRPADFMQNLADIHGKRIRDEGRIVVPAGKGRSAFVDVEDIGIATVAVLQDRERCVGQGYDLTGPQALMFGDVARTMSEVLGRSIAYVPVSVPRFIASELRRGRSLALALVMSALYSVQRFGRAAPVKPDFERLTGQKAGDLASYVERERAAFAPQE